MGKYTDEQTTYATLGERADAEVAALTAALAEARNALEMAQADDTATAAQIDRLNLELVSLTSARDAAVTARDKVAAELKAAQADDAADEAQIAKLAADLAVANVRIAQLLAGAPVQDGRPTGAGYVALESLYRPNDTLQAVLAKVTDRKVCTLPEGRWEAVDFTAADKGAIDVPAACGGIVGVSRGAFGEASGTVLTVKPLSNSRTALVPVQTPGGTATNEFVVLRCVNPPGPVEFSDFAVEGTDQGADYRGNFGGFKIHNQRGVTARRLRVSGWKGDSGAPPGEMMGMYVNGAGKVVLESIEVDGRRAPGGRMFGAAGLTVQNNNGAQLSDIVARGCRAAGFVAYQATNGRIRGLTVDSLTSVDPTTEYLGNGGVNFERTAGWVVDDLDVKGRPKKVHITHSNDGYVLTTPEGSFLVANGSLTLIDPTFNDLWGNGWLYLQSWGPDYGVGTNSPYGSSSMLWPSGAAKVIHTDGRVRTYNHIINGTGHQMTSVAG